MKIKKDDIVEISVGGRKVEGKVTRVNNSPSDTGIPDKWDYWDLEYTIIKGGYAVGDPGRWKQNTDGGSVAKKLVLSGEMITIAFSGDETEPGGAFNDPHEISPADQQEIDEAGEQDWTPEHLAGTCDPKTCRNCLAGDACEPGCEHCKDIGKLEWGFFYESSDNPDEPTYLIEAPTGDSAILAFLETKRVKEYGATLEEVRADIDDGNIRITRIEREAK